MLNRLILLIKIYWGQVFVIITGIASIASLVLFFTTSVINGAIALAIFAVFLLIILLKLFSVLDKIVRFKTKNGYLNIATYYRYYTTDGKVIDFGVQKHIMCKQAVQSNYTHEFYWTGSKIPEINSDTMSFVSVTKGSEGSYDKANFQFKKPLMYNDVGIAHVSMLLDDSDLRSQPFIMSRVEGTLNLLHFEVVLKHKAHQENVPDARLLKKNGASQVDLGFNIIKTIPFDHLTASYETTIYDLSVGYIYKIEWDR